MPPKKQKPGATPPDREQYRKPYKQARVRQKLADLAEQAADELAQDFTQFVNDAVRERLERLGKWPPKPSP
jgi:hypothetical protein